MTLQPGFWSFNSSGYQQPMFYQNADYLSFGAPPYVGTVANNPVGTTSIPFTTLIFDNSYGMWADSTLAAAQISASTRGLGGIWDTGFYC